MDPALITAIAVDDEPRALEVLRLHADKVPYLRLERSFRRPLEALEYLRRHPVDLIFLDINMSELSGLDFRALIGPVPLIVFTTAYSEYAVAGFEQQALDYLVKPIRFERFLRAAMRAQEQLAKVTTPASPVDPLPQRQIFVKSGSKHYRLSVAEIRYVSKDGNYVFFHTADQRIMSRLTVSQLLALLPEAWFVQIHKSYIVSLLHVDVVENDQVIVAGQALPLTKTHRGELVRRLEGGG